MKAVHVIIEGRVQGVGFRAWVEREALKRQLTGYTRNLHSGAVEALFQGEDAAVDAMLAVCNRGPRLAAVTRVLSEPVAEAKFGSFEIRPTA